MKRRSERVTEIYAEIREEYGGWPCTHNLAKYLRVDDRKVKRLLDGVPAIKDGRSTRYRARAVAERLADLEARI